MAYGTEVSERTSPPDDSRALLASVGRRVPPDRSAIRPSPEARGRGLPDANRRRTSARIAGRLLSREFVTRRRLLPRESVTGWRLLPRESVTGRRLLSRGLLLALLLLPTTPGAQPMPPQGGPATAVDVLPFRILYGNPGTVPAGETACYLWNEGGRLHLRIVSDEAPHEVSGELRVAPDGLLKDVSVEPGRIRVRQPLPALLQFDLRTSEPVEELSVVLAGDVDILSVDLQLDGRRVPDALRIGERQERPVGLPADLALTGARSDWIERFGFN